MPRFINPVPEYKPNSKLYFFRSSTNTPIITYKDELETIANTQPVLCDAAGNTPNVFYSGSAKLIVLDEYDVQYIERDPVGGEKELGDFSLWDVVVIYDEGDFVEASDGKFYQSLSNGNVGNANITYAIGGVTQSSSGNLWKALTVNGGNNPETDSGTNWIPAIDGAKVPEVISLEALSSWDIPKVANFTGVTNESRQIDASAYTVDVTLPVLTIGDSFTYHNLITSTFKVQILNPTETIKGTSGDIASGTNMELAPGNSVQMVAKTTTVLSIVGAQV
jgi:hypothetical protein